MVAARAAAVVLVWLLVQILAASGQSSACWEQKSQRVSWNHSCPGPMPYLMFGHGEALHRMDLDGGNHRRVVSGVGRVVSGVGSVVSGVGRGVLLDYHYVQRSVFWTHSHTGDIYRAGLTGTLTQKLLSSQLGVSGLAVDWLEDRVYWTNEERGDIRRVSITGHNQETVFSGLDRPCCMVLDPNQSLQKADLLGGIPTALLKVPGQLTALTLDPVDQRLFWARFNSDLQGTLGSCDYNGNNSNIIDHPLRSPSVWLSVFLDEVFFTESHSIKRINKYGAGEATDVNAEPLSRAAVGLRVVHPLNQPVGGAPPPNPDINECSLWNHGCSLGCENLPGSYACSCPEGYSLLPDRKSCHEMTECVGVLRGCGLGCLDTEAGPVCVCPEGSGLMENRQQYARTTVTMVTSSPTPIPPHRHGDSQACPLSHASFCFYQGTCRYLREMEAYACK
ncbi:hypothetical protein NHX12_010976 [Muraenolepis orangiensis]|uniref:EGF-like domain-containing protein n=1 Tax=Muraenolepis orangiensis TaxID=630683 RepID=A0A9Q0DF90_9TELE|nr:hypothetical protein NHX12_010976 [Muraenolepis orangiensis]